MDQFRLPLIGIMLFVLVIGTSPALQAKTLFEDDFAGVETALPTGVTRLYPDRDKWGFTFWPGLKWPDSYGNGTNWLEGNAESQVYASPFLDKVKGVGQVPKSLRYDPFTIGPDGLHIKAALLSPAQQAAYGVGGEKDSHRRFGSGILLSRFAFTYGHVELVAKLPDTSGSWPAFWLLPTSHEWPPEIDVFEGMNWGSHKNQIHVGILTTRGSRSDFKKWIDLGADPSDGFHTYTLDWTPQTITVGFDGRKIAEQATPAVMHQDMYLLLNLAVGGKWPYNELGISPKDSVAPDRLARGADAIQAGYAADAPAELIVRSVKVMRED